MKAKVLVVVPDSGMGGITSSAVNFVGEISKNGYDVDVLVMDGTKLPSDCAFKYINLKGLSSYWKLGMDSIRSANALLIPFLLMLALLKKFLIRCSLWYPFVFAHYRISGYDIALGYRQGEACYYFLKKCVGARRKVALIHGNYRYMGETGTWDYLLRDFDYVACVSKAISLDFKEAFPSISNKFVTLYNMFDIDGIQKKANEVCGIKVDDTKRNIISVARHENTHKKLNRIPEAVNLLVKDGYTNFHWYVVGGGPDMEYNISLADSLKVSDYITFCGAMSNPFPLQKQCDFSVLTSLTEAYSMSVIESLIREKPIIVMRYPGIEEAVSDGVNGLIAEQTVESLVSKIELLVEDNRLLSELSDNTIQQHVSNEEALQQFEFLLNNRKA